MAEALVGGAFLSACLQVLFDRLAKEHVLDYIRGRGHNMKKQVNKLEKRLRKVESFLNDAENKQYKNKSVKEWLDELRDVVYDAEDLIEDVATEAQRKKLKLEDQSQTTSSFLPSFSSNPLLKLKKGKTIRNIKKITQNFDKLEQERCKLGLEQVAPWSSSSSSITISLSRETTSLVDESRVYGRDGDKEKIIDLLLLPKETARELSVIPIVGMGGVGKTTMAQLVYNENHRLKDHFTLKAWVCVSDEFDVKRITKEILESVTSDQDWSKFNNLNSLQVGVEAALNGKKFLIVLDDVWDNSSFDWDLLSKPFGVGAAGSAIIVTTRDGEMTSKIRTVDNHYLQPLSEADCWSVFVQHAFRIISVDANPNLAKLGKEIVSKCKGLPLAAKSLGGLLCSKEEECEWKSVLNSKIWNLPEEKNGILPVLKLSYYYLQSHLKRCFAYCSIFPKDYEFEERMVVLLWMAEGFLEQPEGNMDMEDFGRKCFRELLLRSFFQPSSNEKGRFVMHDLMSDLAQWIAGKTCFRLEDSSGISKISHKARHSSYLYGIGKFEVFNRVDYLRTLLILNSKGDFRCLTSLTSNVVFDLLSKLKFLRVLYLRGYENISELPSSVSDHMHLRYLDLSGTKIESLPDSVTTMYNLQTLLLMGCSHLKKLPEELGNLINLRHLDISNANLIEWMPPRLGRLSSLRELSDFVVGKDCGSWIGELKHLKHLLGTLRISKLENLIDAQQASEANLSDKEGLNGVCLEFDDQQKETDGNEVLEKLRPHENLKELNIWWFSGVSFPSWLGDPSFSNMVLIGLYGCERCTTLPPLGKLEKLKELRIVGIYQVDKVGIEFYGEGCSNPFPSLEILSFEDMRKWTHWFSCEIDNQVEMFPRLRELSIVGCPELLGSLPDHLPATLERLQIWQCSKLESIGESFHNNTLLDYIDIEDCESLKSLPENLHTLPRLSGISTSNCPSLLRFPDRGLPSANLVQLRISKCERLAVLPPMHGLTQLRQLDICDCPSIESFPKEGFATNITSLNLIRLNIRTPLVNWGLHRLASLINLCIYGGCSASDVVSFPADEEIEIVLPSSLIYLTIGYFPHLESLSSNGFQNLSSLRKLSIYNCPKLQSFPKKGLFPSLMQLVIDHCPLLKQRCKMDRGQEWPKISHVRRVIIDRRVNWSCFGEPVDEFPSQASQSSGPLREGV